MPNIFLYIFFLTVKLLRGCFVLPINGQDSFLAVPDVAFEDKAGKGISVNSVPRWSKIAFLLLFFLVFIYPLILSKLTFFTSGVRRIN